MAAQVCVPAPAVLRTLSALLELKYVLLVMLELSPTVNKRFVVSYHLVVY